MSEKPQGTGGAAPDAEQVILLTKAALIKEALEDPAFRRLALRDADEAVRRCRFIPGERGLPRGLAMRVIEETPQRLYLVIPPGDQPPRSEDPDNPKHRLLRKAMADPKYLQRLTRDPKAVLEEEFLVEVPAGFAVEVLRETAGDRVVVLPAALGSEQRVGVSEDLLEYQASAWGGDDCNRTFLGSLIENLCRPGPTTEGPPESTQFQDPFCTTWECGVEPM